MSCLSLIWQIKSFYCFLRLLHDNDNNLLKLIINSVLKTFKQQDQLKWLVLWFSYASVHDCLPSLLSTTWLLLEGPTKGLSEVNQWQIFVSVFCGLTWLIFIFISFDVGIWNWPLHPCAGPLVPTERSLLIITFWTQVLQHQPNVPFPPLLSHFDLSRSIPRSLNLPSVGWHQAKKPRSSSLRSLCWSSPLFCVNKLIAQLKVISTPIFTAHSSPLPFIQSVNIGTTDERGDDPNAAAAGELWGIPPSFAHLWATAGKEAQISQDCGQKWRLSGFDNVGFLHFLWCSLARESTNMSPGPGYTSDVALNLKIKCFKNVALGQIQAEVQTAALQKDADFCAGGCSVNKRVWNSFVMRLLPLRHRTHLRPAFKLCAYQWMFLHSHKLAKLTELDFSVGICIGEVFIWTWISRVPHIQSVWRPLDKHYNPVTLQAHSKSQFGFQRWLSRL